MSCPEVPTCGMLCITNLMVAMWMILTPPYFIVKICSVSLKTASIGASSNLNNYSRLDAFGRLSPTPDEAFSRGCSGRQVVPRLLNWALFLHRSSQQTFYFATTHFDNNMPCQPFSANLLKSRAWVLNLFAFLLLIFSPLLALVLLASPPSDRRFQFRLGHSCLQDAHNTHQLFWLPFFRDLLIVASLAAADQCISTSGL